MKRANLMALVVAALLTAFGLRCYVGSDSDAPWLWPEACHVNSSESATAIGAAKPKRVISLSVFVVPFHRDATEEEIAGKLAPNAPTPSSTNRYTIPVFNAIVNWRGLLPEWTVRVNVPRGFPLASHYKDLGAEVVEHNDFHPRRWAAATTWRFLVEDDPDVEVWASRESESVPTYQDAAALRHWLASPYAIHALLIRGTNFLIAGTWGARRGYLTEMMGGVSMHAAVREYAHHINVTRAKPFGAAYGDDQSFMYAHVHRFNLSQNAIGYVEEARSQSPEAYQHCKFAACVPWPVYPGSPDGFLASANIMSQNELILCHFETPPFCRRVKFAYDVLAWRELYELCSGRSFDTRQPAPGPRLDMSQCPWPRPAPSVATPVQAM